MVSLIAVIYVTLGLAEGSQRLVSKFSPPENTRVLAEGNSHLFEVYRVRVTPFVFLVDQHGLIVAKGLCDKRERLVQILQAINVKVPQLEVVTAPTESMK